MAEEDAKPDGQADGAATGNQQQFAIQKLYLRDASFEAPGAPEVFSQAWKPETNVELNAGNRRLNDELVEVVLTVTVTAKQQERTAYLCEVQQAGVFTIQGFDDGTFQGLVGSYCPGLLFPYAREAISDLTGKGGFPPLVLAPINFDALYAQERARRSQQPAADAEAEAGKAPH